jgi:hypothetical protein
MSAAKAVLKDSPNLALTIAARTIASRVTTWSAL